MEHAELVRLGARWLRQQRGCAVILEEFKAHRRIRTIPDLVGWTLDHHGRVSYLIECKVSRADYHAEARKHPCEIGDFRLFLTPAGLIDVHDLPGTYGLLWAHPDGSVSEQTQPPPCTSSQDLELELCLNALRKKKLPGGGQDVEVWLAAICELLHSTPGITAKEIVGAVGTGPYASNQLARKQLLKMAKDSKTSLTVDLHAVPYRFSVHSRLT